MRAPSGLPVDPQPRARHEWAFLAVVAGVALGLVVVAADRFRLGSALLAGSVLLGAALRAFLPERQAGLLVVRSRVLDVLGMGALGGALLLLTMVVPPPS